MDNPNGRRQREWSDNFARRNSMAPRREPQARDDGPPYRLDTATGEPHARERHTFDGIWAARKAKTDHVDTVAVFASEADLNDAIRNMPTARSAWRGKGGGFYEAFVGNVGYKGVLLGDTMKLDTCFPTGGAGYPKAWLDRLLKASQARSSEAFWTGIDRLTDIRREVDALARAPASADGRETEELRGLHRTAEAAVERGDAAGAQRGLDSLRLRWNAIQQAADERAAAQKRQREARDAESVLWRNTISAAIKEGDKAKAEEFYAKMKAGDIFVSPPMIKDLQAMGIVT